MNLQHPIDGTLFVDSPTSSMRRSNALKAMGSSTMTSNDFPWASLCASMMNPAIWRRVIRGL